MFENVTFAFPYLLFGLLIIPVMIFYYLFKLKKKTPFITYSNSGIFNDLKPTIKERLKDIPFIFRMIAIALLVIAAARPQTFSSGENVYTEGIDVAMLLDISGSMLAEDFKPNRLEAAKNVIDDFIGGRTTDKIGLVIFAKESFTQCPLTIDYQVLQGLLKEIRSGMIEDGTAIGNAIANGVNRLKESKSKSKVLILLTDGVNNSGEIDPITAAQIAKQFDIRIYTVGVGTVGQAPYPFDTPFGKRYQMVPVEIDEAILQKVADLTGGKYFRATNNKKLEDIYLEIDKLEKTKVEITSYRQATELFYLWALFGFLFLIAENILSRTYLRTLP